jgi:hypothetical protein
VRLFLSKNKSLLSACSTSADCSRATFCTAPKQ